MLLTGDVPVAEGIVFVFGHHVCEERRIGSEEERITEETNRTSTPIFCSS